MVLNRRAMLQTGLGAIALGLSGCKSTKTTVVFVNSLPVALSIAAFANGQSFKRNKIQPGHSATQVYNSNDTLGKTVPVTGTATPVGAAPIDLAPAGLTLKLGYRNTITVKLDPVTHNPVVTNVVT